MRHQSDPAKIMVVEDDAVLGQVLARVLTRPWQTAVHVPDTCEALRLVRIRWPRVVLLDLNLRDGTALRLAEAMRAVWAGLPLIFLTGYLPHKSALPNWVDRLVTKSISLPELRRAVAAVLAQDRANA
jgi:DNA-binding response OmpR family regulator